MNWNKVFFGGRLVRDPVQKYLPSNTSVTEWGMVANRKFRTANGEDREEATFVDVTAFGKTGEVIAQYCKKGDELFVEARLKQDVWEDRNGGGKRSKLSLVLESFQFVGGKRQGEQGNGKYDNDYPQAGGAERKPIGYSRQEPSALTDGDPHDSAESFPF